MGFILKGKYDDAANVSIHINQGQEERRELSIGYRMSARNGRTKTHLHGKKRQLLFHARSDRRSRSLATRQSI